MSGYILSYLPSLGRLSLECKETQGGGGSGKLGLIATILQSDESLCDDAQKVREK